IAFGNAIVVTRPPFLRSRYSLRWRKTTTLMPNITITSARGMDATSTEHPQVATSTASADDYYVDGEADNMVPK
ncbi:CG34296, partial [Drosophila busckii]